MILLTGSSGFLGQVIYSELAGYQIKTLGRKNADYIAQLDKDVPFFNRKFEFVIHSAGKAHFVPKTISESEQFFNVNVKGTLNLLKGLEIVGLPKSFIFISSVAVYGLECGWLINEDAPLLATDAYGRSKIEAEKIVADWCKINGVICTILRLPLIAGPNAPGNLKAMIKGIKSGYYFNIAGGEAKKSIVLATDVAKIIPTAAAIGGTYNLTDTCHPSFIELSTIIAQQLGKPVVKNMPYWLANLMAKMGDILGGTAPIDSVKLKKIMSDLTFDDSRAQKVLGWKPASVLKSYKID
jgi:nucleoside-diphosphate-sugar epimerase